MQGNVIKRAEWIMSALQQYQAGVPVYTILLNHSISEDTLFEWYRRFQNMNMEQLQHVCSLEDENTTLQRLVVSLTGADNHPSDNNIMQSLLDSVLHV